METGQFNGVLRLVVSAKEYRVFIHLVAQHVLLIHTWSASGRAKWRLLVVHIHRKEIRRIQLVDTTSSRKVVVIVIVDAEIEGLLHRHEQTDMTLVARQGQPARVGMVAIVLWYHVLLEHIGGKPNKLCPHACSTAIGIVFPSLAKPFHELEFIKRNTELHTDFRERCYRLHRLHTIRDTDIALSIYEIYLVDNNLQLVEGIIVLNICTHRYRVGILSVILQTYILSLQML